MPPLSSLPLPRSRTNLLAPSAVGGPRPGLLTEEAKAALLARIVDNPPLPTPPAIALQVLEKASHPACNLQEIEGLISADPALCGKLLKTVNSALYGLPRAVTTVRQAFNLFGINAIRSLVLSLSLPVLQRSRKQGSPSNEFQDFCKSSVAGAIVARELALRLDWPSPEDHLVAGLLRDLGVLVLPKIFPEEAVRYHELPPEERALQPCELEEEYFGLTHAEISAHLVRHWRLPPEISEPIRYHHHPELAQQRARPYAPRAALLYFASQVAQLQLTPRPPELLKNILLAAAQHFGMNEAQVMQFLEPLNRRVEEFATLIQVDIGVCENFPTLLASATEELIKLSVATSLENLRERDRRSQAEQEARQWRRAAEQVRSEAVRDPLTGCFNRGYFKEALTRAYKVARRRCTLLGLIFLDLDGFKILNDRFGHLFGDQVLQSVAAKLHAGIRATDIVARYGGDEFCIIVPDTTEAGLEAMAQRLRADVASLSVRQGRQTASVAASVGGVICLPYRSRMTPEAFLAAADEAMYTAKKQGKNQVTITALLSEEDREFLEAIRRRLFSTFLLERERIRLEDCNKPPRPLHSPGSSLARLARRLGWIDNPQLAGLLREQRLSRQPFQDVAQQLGLLTPGQIAALLALQRQCPEIVGQHLVAAGLFNKADLQRELQAYYHFLQETVMA